MGASHQHGPSPASPLRSRASLRRLRLSLALVLVYMVAEVVGGLWTGSLALLADAAHMLADAGALGLALFATWFAGRPSGARHTYGFHRTEILVALANGAVLVATALLILREALHRFVEPPVVQGLPMMAIAAGGLVVNLVSLRLLHAGRHESLNMHGAFLHVLSDTLGSVQAVLAGALILAFDWRIADPLASVLIALLVIASAWGLLKEAVAVLMESAPAHVDVDEVERAILSVPGAAGVHDLHVWTITSGLHALSAHVDLAPGADPERLLAAIRETLHEGFGLDHLTIQLEPAGFVERGSC